MNKSIEFMCFTWQSLPHCPKKSSQESFGAAYLLERRDLIKVGRQVNGDVSRLNSQYDLRIDKGVELGSLAKRRDAVDDGRYGLDILFAEVLGKHLREDEGARYSRWDKDLTTRQIKYAALYALASLLAFQKLEEINEVGDYVTMENIRSGLRASLHPASNTDICAGYGIIQ